MEVWKRLETRSASLIALAFHDPEQLKAEEEELYREKQPPKTAEEIFAAAEAALEMMRSGGLRRESV